MVLAKENENDILNEEDTTKTEPNTDIQQDAPKKEKKEKKQKDIKETAELKELQEKYVRLAAEYDNFRKRTAKERDGMFLDGFAAAATDFLPVADNLERAMSAEGDAAAVRDGVMLISKQMRDVLQKLGIVEIESSPGTLFDPQLHNAVMHVEGEGGANGESVIDETLMKGYKKNDIILRHAMVRTRG